MVGKLQVAPNGSLRSPLDSRGVPPGTPWSFGHFFRHSSPLAEHPRDVLAEGSSGWYPLVMTNIAMENGPFIVDFPS